MFLHSLKNMVGGRLRMVTYLALVLLLPFWPGVEANQTDGGDGGVILSRECPPEVQCSQESGWPGDDWRVVDDPTMAGKLAAHNVFFHLTGGDTQYFYESVAISNQGESDVLVNVGENIQTLAGVDFNVEISHSYMNQSNWGLTIGFGFQLSEELTLHLTDLGTGTSLEASVSSSDVIPLDLSSLADPANWDQEGFELFIFDPTLNEIVTIVRFLGGSDSVTIEVSS